MNLREAQALQLIDKLDFKSDNPNLKQDFKKEIKDTLYRTHYEFTSNPLLLTIMLITYGYCKNISNEMHKFYDDAYEALSILHDQAKQLNRQFYTNLDKSSFKRLFAHFCYELYMNEQLDFSKELGYSIFINISKKMFPNQNISYDDFIKDLDENLCMIYFEGGLYHFTHRSFQEYFTALVISQQNDKYFINLGLELRKNNRIIKDSTFSLLYGLALNKVEKNILLPFLDDLIKECESKEKLETYILNYYDRIEFTKGTPAPGGVCCTTSISKLLHYVLKINGERAIKDFKDMPTFSCLEFFETNTYHIYPATITNEDEEDKWEIVSALLIDDPEINQYEIVGRDYGLYPKLLFKRPHDGLCRELIEYLLSCESEFFKDYELIKKYLKDLKEKYENKIEFEIDY